MMAGRFASSIIAVLLIVGYTNPVAAQDKGQRKPSGKGGALLTEHCTKCHNLDEVVRLRQTREQWENTVYSMVARGAPIYTHEADQIVDYLSKTFGPEPVKKDN